MKFSFVLLLALVSNIFDAIDGAACRVEDLSINNTCTCAAGFVQVQDGAIGQAQDGAIGQAQAGLVAKSEEEMIRGIEAMGVNAVNGALASAGKSTATPEGSLEYNDALSSFGLSQPPSGGGVGQTTAQLGGKDSDGYKTALISLAAATLPTPFTIADLGGATCVPSKATLSTCGDTSDVACCSEAYKTAMVLLTIATAQADATSFAGCTDEVDEWYTDVDGCTLDSGGCNGDTQAICSLGDGVNTRTCTCAAGSTGTNAALADATSFAGCTADEEPTPCEDQSDCTGIFDSKGASTRCVSPTAVAATRRLRRALLFTSKLLKDETADEQKICV